MKNSNTPYPMLTSRRFYTMLLSLVFTCWLGSEKVHAAEEIELSLAPSSEDTMWCMVPPTLSRLTQSSLQSVGQLCEKASSIERNVYSSFGRSVYQAQRLFRKVALNGLVLFGIGISGQFSGVYAGSRRLFETSEPYFVKALGGSGDDYGNSITEVTNSDLVITGWTRSFGAGLGDVLIQKLDANGAPLWGKALGGTSMDISKSSAETMGGDLVLAGCTESFGAGASDVLVSRLTASGTLLWAKAFGGTSDDCGSSITEVTNGDFVLVGDTTSFGAGNYDVLVSKLSANGTLLWAKIFGGIGSDVSRSVTETTNGDLVLTGYTTSFGAGGIDILVSRLSPNGTLIWMKAIGGASDDHSLSIREVTNGDLVLTGEMRSLSAGYSDVFVSRLNANGTLLWAKIFGGANWDVGYSITETTNGDLILTGRTESFGAGVSDALVSRLNASGTLLWTKVLGETSEDYGRFITETTNGDLMLTGYTASFGAGAWDVLVSRLSGDSETTDCTTLVQTSFMDITANISFINVLPNMTDVTIVSSDISGSISVSNILLSEETVCWITNNPTQFPSYNPSFSPSIPSYYPSYYPTLHPSYSPSYAPSYSPSGHPSCHPTLHPSYTPTSSPTYRPNFLASNTSSVTFSMPVIVVITTLGTGLCCSCGIIVYLIWNQNRLLRLSLTNNQREMVTIVRPIPENNALGNGNYNNRNVISYTQKPERTSESDDEDFYGPGLKTFAKEDKHEAMMVELQKGNSSQLMDTKGEGNVS